jgi:two-component system OmpR family sensor kinase
MAERSGLLGRSIRVRLVVRTSLAAVVVIIAAGWAATAVVDHQLRDQIDRRLVSDIDGALLTMDVLTAEQLEEMSQRSPRSRYVVLVIDEDGTRVASAPDDAGDLNPVVGDLTSADVAAADGLPFTVPGGPEVRVVARPMPSGDWLGFAVPLDQVSSAISTVRWWVGLIGLAAVGVLAVAVSLIGRSVVKPIEEIIDTADAIGDGKTDRRVPTGQPDAESERLATALNAMLGRLSRSFEDQEASEAELRDFVSEAAHELRTPLATIQASAELLQDPNLDETEVAANARRVETQSQRIAHLIDDLVLLARLRQGAELQWMDVDLGELAQEAVERAAARQPLWPVSLEADGSPVVVSGDPLRLEQVVDDLLVNVATHTPQGTTAVVRVHREGDEAVLEVSDDGPGLPEAELARASERLYRGSAARADSRPGSGLGLAIVRGVTEAHAGTLELRAADGFTAVLRLPLASTDDESLDDDRHRQPARTAPT